MQDYLETQNDFQHNFGIGQYTKGAPQGKMFGVLVVQDKKHNLGYLTAYSGAIPETTGNYFFVPPVYDVLNPEGDFMQNEVIRNALNKEVDTLEQDTEYLQSVLDLDNTKNQAQAIILIEKEKIRQAKKLRKQKRMEGQAKLSPEDFIILKEQLAKESVAKKNALKKIQEHWNEKISEKENALLPFEEKLLNLKTQRKQNSRAQQQMIFDNYKFLNKNKTVKTINDIFPNTQEHMPPSGTGDCAAPKLLQYAFQNDLTPISMGEFWWGASPAKEIRKHGVFYPACGSRCKPILEHMLAGIELEENPFIQSDLAKKEIKIVYEDPSMLIINKPAELLSVRGKLVSDSVQTRIQALYPELEGPFIVHRLDMSTSGLMILAKTREDHKALQKQFIEKTVQKRYVAILNGIISQDAGTIELPLCLDILDRPRQLVCDTHGKYAKTEWKVVERTNNKTRIHFFPITGRTHQLRVHASHPKGLNTSILGDDLYGTKSDRLYLHAEQIIFQHPRSGNDLNFTEKASF